ncbi:hypothetical protein GCM10010912_10850 [Paenibacillus albidus]|uniref:Uncharacterized protein n=1 Tax=Paenibacillus albidus TaxID=2041023 RepID=A0A917C1T7_9BACL|nr:Imm50 family immunity protein [Paenibacillus albidus]GGF67690.1 hypothetical protein GCM10010912_10850 [Paenibacillus albidus]
MKSGADSNVQVRSVVSEALRFPGSQHENMGYRLHLHKPQLLDVVQYDWVQITVGTAGTSSWAAFRAVVMDSRPESLLIYASPQYGPQLQHMQKLKRIFSPLQSIQGAEQLIESYGYMPPFHYHEISCVAWEVTERGTDKNLLLAILSSPAVPASQHIVFRFDGVHEDNLSPFEDKNVILQLDFSYEGESIRVKCDSEQGFGGQFLCRSVSIGRDS